MVSTNCDSRSFRSNPTKTVKKGQHWSNSVKTITGFGFTKISDNGFELAPDIPSKKQGHEPKEVSERLRMSACCVGVVCH